MIKFENNNESVMIEVNGNIPTITEDTVLMIKTIYDQLVERSESAGAIYKELLTKAITEDLPFISAEEISQKAEEAKKENEERRKTAGISKEEIVKTLAEAIGEFLCD